MNNILNVFLKTDMRNQHDGLVAIAKKRGVNLSALEFGDHVVFTNKAMDRIKLYSSNGVLSYVKSQSGKLNMGIIEMIPRCFDSKSGVNWNKAEKLALEKQLEKLPRNKAPVLKRTAQREASLQ